MLAGLWGKKIGMTQVFAKDKAVPVSVIDVSDWIVMQVKTDAKDGYASVKVGCLRPRYAKKPFSQDWLKKPKTYFSDLKEIKILNAVEATVGQPLDFKSVLQDGDVVDALGWVIGRGFQGAVKRHGFAGGRASHGAKVGRRPGSLSFMRSQGRVIKGKRLPGHMGTNASRTRNLEVVKVQPEDHLILVKGPVPGKSGSLVYLRKVQV